MLNLPNKTHEWLALVLFRYIIWICIELVTVYFFFVETAGHTLEELSSIFEAKNPRKASTKKVKVEMNADGDVLGIDGHAV